MANDRDSTRKELERLTARMRADTWLLYELLGANPSKLMTKWFDWLNDLHSQASESRPNTEEVDRANNHRDA